MTNEEAKAFLDNLKILVSEHPVVADWLVEIADRKTEPQTETSTNAKKHQLTDEPQTADKCKGCIYENDQSLMACVSCQGKVPQTEIPEYAEWKNAYEKMSSYGEREGK